MSKQDPHPFEKQTTALRKSIAQAILGKDDVIELLIIALLAEGHILIEDVPGVGKTTLALALAKSIDGTFQRIQFTSDLLPSDLVGVPVYNAQSREFEFKAGPVFANIVLADEINRTTPKTQSALLEAMQDGKVTVDLTTHQLPKPFMVLATQNPIEFHGTYPLPESQLDRFIMRITMGYPSPEEELRILREKGHAPSQINIKPVCSGAEIAQMQRATSEVKVDASISKYILDIASKTREVRDLELGVSPKTREVRDLELGVSPRGTLALHRAVQARAFVLGRTYAIPDDVKALTLPVLTHRLIVSGRKSTNTAQQDARTIAQSILREILGSVEVPV